jgi:hypothetical protein
MHSSYRSKHHHASSYIILIMVSWSQASSAGFSSVNEILRTQNCRQDLLTGENRTKFPHFCPSQRFRALLTICTSQRFFNTCVTKVRTPTDSTCSTLGYIRHDQRNRENYRYFSNQNGKWPSTRQAILKIPANAQ